MKSREIFGLSALAFLIIGVYQFTKSDAVLGIIYSVVAVVLYGYSKSKSGPDKSDKGES